MHPPVDFEHWATLFPKETFERTSGPRQYDSTEPGDPLDLWKAQGAIITSPAELCEIELVRKEYEKTKDLGPAVPVDIFMWSVEPPEKPYLTKLGGTPHREAGLPWPTIEGMPLTFVGQFCFADSRDIVSDKLPNDVMLIFFKDAESIYDRSGVYVEWSSIELESPLSPDQCPAPSFTVPQLSGHIYRTNEYPESWEVFEQAGHDQCYLFPTTQSTKIGRETYFIQGGPNLLKRELFCALNSVDPPSYPSECKWPLIGLEALPDDWDQPDDHDGWGKYQMMFGDVGCMYFMIDEQGRVSWDWDCY
ncbi:DUF1963 domain-containing protein [Aeoliella mucimassa]|uniref:DUF1963 domain-containing protein n=1 Tax=Aeoliella mucimassa TaxID=2527972 RepID=UPI0018D2EBE5|nr:DUF1963 domain-containing protein [Aeoliella mucimassa]